MVQNILFGPLRRRGRVDPVDHSHLLRVDLHAFDQSTDDLAASHPVGILEALLDPIGEVPEMPDDHP
jgi:hypothetical protein